MGCSEKLMSTSNSPIQNGKNCVIHCEQKVVCYKFLYNDDYAVELNEKTFWGYGTVSGEFAYRNLSFPFTTLQKSLQSFEEKKNFKEFTYKYAFVSDCKDTIYSDVDLEKWIVKKNGKPYFYQYNKDLTNKKDTLNTKGLKWTDNFFR